MPSNLCGKPRRDGEACGYRMGPQGCPHHDGDTSRAKVFQSKGALAAKMRHALPEHYVLPKLDTLDGIDAASRELFVLALKHNLERWRLSEARGALALLIQSQQVRVQQQLNESLLKLEHGGAAIAFLARLQDGLAQGRRQPLPGRAALPLAQEMAE